MEALLRRVYESPGLAHAMRILSVLCVAAALPVYGILIWKSLSVSVVDLLLLLVITGVPFVLVTLLRRAINAPRPYELYGFYSVPPKNKSGRSFPSRHVFSIFLIGTAATFPYPLLGISLLALGIVMAVCRVLLGIHFIRDVVAGAVLGAVCGVIGVLIAQPFI